MAADSFRKKCKPDQEVVARLNYLTEVSKALSSERDIDRLLETILDAAKTSPTPMAGRYNV
ncbi:MAG: hypothetical protein ABIP64_09765 [Burkholderiales bacterium]